MFCLLRLVVLRQPPRSRLLLAACKPGEQLSDAILGRLVLETAPGGKRILQKLTGAQLPRIC